MRAAIVKGAGQTPVYGEFREASAGEGAMVVTVKAAALSPLSKSRSMGLHYSSEGIFPAVAGAEGVGVTEDGRRVYFVLPEAPFGTLAERCVVRPERCVVLPDGMEWVTAAALANPGMSVWAALVKRAQMKAGETVLIHGATGTAGRLAVQMAKHLGAGKVLASARNAAELEEVRAVGADEVIPFRIDAEHGRGAKEFEMALEEQIAAGVDVVLDYLWGESARSVMVAIAKGGEEGRPVRFVQVGSASGEESLALPAAALRSSAMVLMGSGVKSVPMEGLLESIGQVLGMAEAARLRVATRVEPLGEVERVWVEAGTRPRVVFTMD